MADLNIGNSSASVVVNTKHNGSVIPQINNTYDLGTSALKWKNIYGDLKGNADTATAATKLATTRTISLTGSVTGSGTFDGSGNLSITTTTNHTHNYAGSASAGGSANSAVKLDTATAGDSNTPVYFSGGKPVACTSLDLNTSGNAATATKLATARSISLDTGVTSTATSFDGSNNITIPVNSIKESYLTWGGRNFNGAYGCIDAAMVSDLGANRLMFGKAAGITIQYSTDGGNNWTDYGASNSEKVGLFSSGHGFRIGKATKDTITANCMLRVIINTDNFGVYTQLNKFVIYLSTEGCNGCYCTIDASLESSPTIFATFANKVPVSGWSGYNVINTSYITTYGNSPSNQYGLIRFTFGCTSVNTNYPGLNIIQIMGFGGVGWGTPSTMAKTGHLYSYDSSQNAAFPATVTAPTFSGALLGNASTATKATQDSAGQQINTTYIKGLSVSGKTITYTKGDGTTGTITTQDNNTTYAAGTGLSLSGTTFNHKNSVTAGTAQGDANKTLTFGGTFTIPTITYDAQGHITGKGTTTMTMPANPNTDTHWTTGITAGETGTTSNSATTNGNTFIKIKDNSTHRGQIKIVGSGATSVSSDANGVITINSTDNNTTYGSMSVDEGTTGTATTNRVLTAANLKGIINAHAPTKTGGGASGTWGISISGNAASASKVNNKLTVGSKSYDGSAAVTIAASDLGLASAMLFLGTTTTAITDGATTNPVTIGGSNKTVTAGNVVLYGSKEFVWTGSAWEELGNEGSYKIVQAAVADPSASGTSNTFIATISQDANGKITATKKTVAVTNSAPTLAWSTTSTIGTVAGTNLQVKMPANPNTDTKVTQTVTTSNAAYPLLLAPSGQTATTTTTSYFDSGVTLNPSTNTIAANVSGNAATATKLATARTIRTNLASTSAVSFDGSANITPGVTGTLPITNGGTGATTASSARDNLGAQSKVLYGPSAPSDSTGSNGDMYVALESGDFKKDIVDLIYPVGSIYITMNSTNPSTLFGGTWEAFGQGRVLIGAGTGNDGSTSLSFTAGGTGGEYKHALTTSEIPSHTHRFRGTTSANSRGHTHTYTKANGVNGHTLTIAEIPSHEHAINYSQTVSQSGWPSGSAYYMPWNPNYNTGYIKATATGGGGSHNHGLSTSSVASGSESQNHTHTFSGITGNAGSGSSHNNIQPYIVVYMWKRTA